MSNNDRSNEALLARRAKADGVTLNPWKPIGRLYTENDYAHMTANSPDAVKADIDEIIHLRSLVLEHEEYIANLELEAQSVDKKIGELAALLGITPDAGNMRIQGYIKDEIQRLQAENARLDREADWLAGQASLWEHDQLDGTGYHIREVPELREQARKAVEKAYKDSKGE